MKNTFIRLMIIAMVLFSASTFASNPSLQEPMGGEKFGHSVKQVGDGLYVFRWWVYRNFFLVTDEGVIVSDPMNAKASKLLSQEIKKITDKPVKFVIYSHNHHDHISGGQIFKDEGAQIIAHRNTLKELAAHPSFKTPLPDITFDHSYLISLGGKTVDLKYFGKNHGESMIVMHIVNENTLFTVDIVTPRRVAFRTMPDFYPDEWIRSLKEIEALNVDYVISGHGPASEPALDKSNVIVQQREYLEDLITAVKVEWDKGTHSPDKLRQIVKLPKYENWRAYDAWLPMNIERIWGYLHMAW